MNDVVGLDRTPENVKARLSRSPNIASARLGTDHVTLGLKFQGLLPLRGGQGKGRRGSPLPWLYASY